MDERAGETVIRIRGLGARRGDRQVLRGIDLDVHRREILVIMGASGSGKSTLMRHMIGLARPEEGSVTVCGHDLGSIDRETLFRLRRDIGVAFQGGALLGSLSVFDNVALPLREHTAFDEATIGIMVRMKLELVNLSGAERLMPSQLSGGMLKRAGLARAVAMDPKLLFFDEPSAGLDPVNSAELDELILKLRSAFNMTVVVVTHELASAFAIADRITVLDEGRQLMTGTVDELRQSRDERVQSLLQRRGRRHPMVDETYLDRLTGGPGNGS